MISLLNILVIMASSVLTLSVIPHFEIFLVVPLLPLFFLIPLAYFKKGIEPFLIAAFAGIIFDLFSAYPFGFYLGFFLLITLLVKIFFQEGMRSLSFWHYLAILIAAVSVFYGAQIGYLLLSETTFKLNSAGTILVGIFVNLLCGILFYAFNIWYFDQTQKIGNYLKRR